MQGVDLVAHPGSNKDRQIEVPRKVSNQLAETMGGKRHPVRIASVCQDAQGANV
jgi:hypothetical protein